MVAIVVALSLLAGPPRYVDSRRIDARGVVLTDLSLSSEPGTLVVSAERGFVFTTIDGGVTWTEAQLLVSRAPYPAPEHGEVAPAGIEYTVEDAFARTPIVGAMGQDVDWLDFTYLGFDVGSLFLFPYGVTDDPVLEFTPDSPAFWGATQSDLALVGGLGPVDEIEDFEEPEPERPRTRIEETAVRMGSMLARLEGPGRPYVASEPTTVNWVEVHPERPEVILACSDGGLFRTTDGGISWVHVLGGETPEARACHYVGFHPRDVRTIWVGTERGIQVSHDGGESFARLSEDIGGLWVQWVEFVEERPEIAYAGTDAGAFRTSDGGKTWDSVYSGYEEANDVMSILVAPEDVDSLMVATGDGIYKNAGESWTLAGGMAFAGVRVSQLAMDERDANHVVAVADTGLYESYDWGKSWSIVSLGATPTAPRCVLFDPVEPDVLWVLTSTEILRLTPRAPSPPEARKVEQLRARLSLEPTLPDTLAAAFARRGLDPTERAAARDRASWVSLLPTLNAIAGVFLASGHSVLEAPFLLGGAGAGGSAVLDRTLDYSAPYFAVFARWDLPELGYAPAQADDSLEGELDARLGLQRELERLYSERRRLLPALVLEPGRARARALLKLRVEELTVMLDSLSGGLWAPTLRTLDDL